MAKENTKSSIVSNNEKKNEEKSSSREDIPLDLKLKHIALEWIASSTSHGLPSVFRTDQIYLKVVWLVCFLASAVACAYIVINYILTFLGYSVNVSTTIATQTPMTFPAVTICNLNPFNTKRALPFIINRLADFQLNYTLSLATVESAFSLTTSVAAMLKSEAAGWPVLNSDTRKPLGFYLDEMMVSCRFGQTDCTSNDFSYFRSYDYGNCYTFNSGFTANGSRSPLNTISTAGPGHSFQIELYAGAASDEYFTIDRGFYVVLHNQSYTPIMDNEGVNVGLGMQTNIGIDRTLDNKLPTPYSTCIKDPTSASSSTSTLYKAILSTLGEKIYRQKYCYRLCYQQKVINACSCYDAAYANPYPNSDGKRINSCHTTSDLVCMLQTKMQFEGANLRTLCEEDCPEECESLTYKTSVSTSSYPSEFYLKWLLMQPTMTTKTSVSSEIKSSMARINVFFNDVSYTVLTESAAVTWDALLGNIGGQLGLFIGISILSLVEIVELAFEIVRTIFLHRRGNRLKNP